MSSVKCLIVRPISCSSSKTGTPESIKPASIRDGDCPGMHERHRLAGHYQAVFQPFGGLLRKFISSDNDDPEPSTAAGVLISDGSPTAKAESRSESVRCCPS